MKISEMISKFSFCTYLTFLTCFSTELFDFTAVIKNDRNYVKPISQAATPASPLVTKLSVRVVCGDGTTDKSTGVHGDEHRPSEDHSAGAASAGKVQSSQHQEVGRRGEISTTLLAVRRRH